MPNTTDSMDDALRYDRMVEDALLSVVHRSLSYVAANGLPGDHHFYITFRTDHPDVQIPDHLRERYPGEMTIILQHQFWDLEIAEEFFSVTLSFSDIPEKLVIPFDSVAAFADPSVRFGLQFDVGESETAAAEAGEPESRPGEETQVETGAGTEVSGVRGRGDSQATGEKKGSALVKSTQEETVSPTGEDRKKDEGGDTDNVVTLDTFRKK